MKKFLPKTGGHRLRLDDLKLLQTAYFDGFKAFASFLDTSLNVILSGINISSNSTTVTNTEGYVTWQGEVFYVAAGSFPKQGTDPFYLTLSESVLPPSPVTYKDLTSQNVHFNRAMVLGYYAEGQGEYLTNFTRASASGVKTGVIQDWYGNVNTNFDSTGLGINNMVGYAVCNGGTFSGTTVPDLRGRFLTGSTNVPASGAPALDGSVGTYIMGAVGGLATVALTADQNGPHTHDVVDPGHIHNIPQGNSYTGAGGARVGRGNDAPNNTPTNSATTGITIGSSGTGAAHENRPPFFASIKIIKL
jgi:hypothetical protein